jgi:hypothetical protein
MNQSAVGRQFCFNLSPFVGLGRMSQAVRLPGQECLKTTVIRNLVQSGQEVLEIARKSCKFGGIEIEYAR